MKIYEAYMPLDFKDFAGFLKHLATAYHHLQQRADDFSTGMIVKKQVPWASTTECIDAAGVMEMTWRRVTEKCENP